MLKYALAIFTGAFLLFQVQPLVGRVILPWHGGTATVWTTCLLFFQLALLAGYLYSHFLATRLSADRQRIVHAIVLAASLLLLPLPAIAKPNEITNPTLAILVYLARYVGLSAIVLAASSPLLAKWYERSSPRTSAYRLYAVSNLGSLLALVSYPFAVEPVLTVKMQTMIWSWCYAGFVAFSLWSMIGQRALTAAA